jgi:hypothetical protein
MTGSRRRRSVTMVALAAIAFAAAPSPASDTAAPTPVIERFLTVRDREVRTSLFSNGVVVVSGRRDGEQLFFRQITLDGDQFAGYLAAIQRDAAELANSDELPSATGSGGHGVVTVHADPSGPLRFSYSSLTVYDLATTRLLNSLDDLEHLVLFGDPTGAGTQGWQPRVGDVVKLRSGGLAEVVEVRDDGTVVLEHQSTYINELVPADRVRSVVFEVVEPAP